VIAFEDAFNNTSPILQVMLGDLLKLKRVNWKNKVLPCGGLVWGAWHG